MSVTRFASTFVWPARFYNDLLRFLAGRCYTPKKIDEFSAFNHNSQIVVEWRNSAAGVGMRIQYVLGCSLAALLAVVSAKPLHAEAYSKAFARAGGRSVDLVDEDMGGTAPHASVSGSAAGAVFRSSASVSVESEGVALHAYAFAEAPPVINEQTFISKCGATARAYWYDDLRVADFSALPLGFVDDLVEEGLQLTIYPNVEGRLSGREYSYHLAVSLNGNKDPDGAANGTYLSDRVSRIGGNLVELLFGEAPVGIVYPNGVNLDTLRISVSMELEVSVESHPGDGPSSGPSEADYSHTVRLGPIIVSDASGNYLPGSEYLNFVGDSGVVYGVQPVPEPSTYLLTATGVPALLFAGRRRVGI